MSLVDCLDGNAKDAHFTLRIFDLIEEQLKELGMFELLDRLIMPSLTMFAEMENEGMDVDVERLEQVGHELNGRNIQEEDSLYEIPRVQKTDNFSSTNDLIELLYTREGGFELYPPDRTPKDAPKVDAPTLKLLLEHIEEELEARGQVGS